MAYSGKGKEKRDWWIKPQDKPSHPVDLAQLTFPFECILEPKDLVSGEFTKNLVHLQDRQSSTLWARYYANYQGAKVAIAMAYGVWCKIEFTPGNQFYTV